MDALLCQILPLVLGYAWLVGISQANEGYLVVTPSVYYQNREEVISVTILKPSEPIYVEAKLFARTGDLIAEAGHRLFGKGTLTLEVPRNAKGHCTLKICGNCVSPREGSFTFYNSSSIMVEEKGTSVFVQTDKPVYKPSQKVLINVITTGPDLRPVNEKLLAYIEDPRGTKMIKWKNQRPLCCGLLNMSYPLSDRPILGKWTIYVELQGQVYNKTFEVKKYVLPKFQVIIQPPAFIRNWDECEVVYVRARYLYDKPVRGQLSTKIMVKGTDYYSTFSSPAVDQIFAIEGMAMFNACISDLMLHANDHFRGKLVVEAEVITADGSSVKVSDASCAVNKHLIDIEFTKDTRRHFKPGLPYRGKLSVYYPDGSPAENVTVAVASRVDGKDYAAQEFISSKGIVSFYVASIHSSARSVWIDAKVVRIQEEEVGQHYLPVYLSISNWYSPSECHVLVEGNADDHVIGEEARFKVRSSCSCNFTMYYEVMSRGNLVHSGIHFARHVRGKRSAQEDNLSEGMQNRAKITFAHEEVDSSDIVVQEEHEYGSVRVCTIFVKFTVTQAMAPFSRLLVYYVKENGEGVADSFMFTVQPGFYNRASLELSKGSTFPGDHVQMHVNSRPGSCVCISAVDKSVHLLKPDYQLSTEEIFEELEEYDISVPLEEDFHVWGWANDAADDNGKNQRRRRSVPWWQLGQSRDALYAFEECGLLVMTDTVQLLFRQHSGSNNDPTYWNPWHGHGYHQVAEFTSSQRALKSHYKAGERRRTYFPETWLWTCFNISSTRKEVALDVQVPDSITTWHVDGFSISPHFGLALAEPVQLTTYKDFFLDFSLPYSVIRGEQVKIPLTIHSYLPTCVRVHVRLGLPEGVHYVPSQDNNNSMERMCLGAEETKVLSPLFVFSGIGWQNISASASAYHDNLCCSGVLIEYDLETEAIAKDSVEHGVLCEAEGLPRSYTVSTYTCPNERLYINTPNRYEFQYVEKPLFMTQFSFDVRASNDVRLALTADPSDNNQMYEIVLGGWSNTLSWITQDMEVDGEKLVVVNSTEVVSGEEFRSFWISWHNGHIEVGYGDDPNKNDSLLMSYITNRPLYVEYVGFSTGWGSEGSFKIWRKSDADMSGSSDMFNLALPMAVIPGSERATITISADVMGPTLHNLRQLLKLPSGCGEQNMIHFAPNIFVLKYLDKTNRLNEEVKESAVSLLVEGYQKQLTFRREDGSYSAFGKRDASGNMWLTAFVVKSFAQAKSYVFIDQKEIDRSVAWIINQQRIDGSFPAVGRLINKEIQGGVQGSIALTAYVVTAFLEVGPKSKLERTSLRGAQKYLENQTNLISDPYTAALTSYALTLLKSEQADVVVKILKEMAIKRDNLMYWSLKGQYQSVEFGPTPEQKVPSAEVEIAAYSLLTFVAMRDVPGALPIVKWLSMQRNALGGFSSTQDTTVALHALSEYASLAYAGQMEGLVTLASTNMDLQEFVLLHENNTDTPQTVQVPSLPTQLFVIVDAVGEGCALIQVDVSYNIPDPSDAPSFDLQVRLGKQTQRDKNRTKPRGTGESSASSAEHEGNNARNNDGGGGDELDNDLNNEVANEFKVVLETCTKWLHNGSSNMAVLEVSLLTGFRPDIESLDRLLQHNHLQLKMYEIQGRKILFYFDEVQNNCLTCISFEAYRTYVVGRTQPVPVRIYDYYEPEYESSRFYNVTHLGELIQDLCEDELCNEIRQQVALPESSEDCNSIFGCYGELDPDNSFCTCYRDCEGAGSEVCASDGKFYSSQCIMKMEACQQDVYLESMPVEYCHPQNASFEMPDEIDEYEITTEPSRVSDGLESSVVTTTRQVEPRTNKAPQESTPEAPLDEELINDTTQEAGSLDDVTIGGSDVPRVQSVTTDSFHASVTGDPDDGDMISLEWPAGETTESPSVGTDTTYGGLRMSETEQPFQETDAISATQAVKNFDGTKLANVDSTHNRADVKVLVIGSDKGTGKELNKLKPNEKNHSSDFVNTTTTEGQNFADGSIANEELVSNISVGQSAINTTIPVELPDITVGSAGATDIPAVSNSDTSMKLEDGNQNLDQTVEPTHEHLTLADSDDSTTPSSSIPETPEGPIV